MWWNRRKPECEKFLELLSRSCLLEQAEIRRACHGVKSRSLEELCAHLVQNGAITQWQRDKLRAGKHRGFYFEKYVLQEQLRNDDVSKTYLAIDLETDKEVGLRITPPSDGTSFTFEIVEL